MSVNIKKYHPLDFDKDISIGIKLPYSNTYSTYTYSGSYQDPLRHGSVSLFEKTYTSADQTLYNLINLILTQKGERLMHPTFGTDIYKYLFEPIDLTIKTKLRQSLISDIKYWMPYLVIEDVVINIDEIDSNKIIISLAFRQNEYSDIQTIRFSFGNTIEYEIV